MVLFPCGACCAKCAVVDAKKLWEELCAKRCKLTVSGVFPGSEAAATSQAFSSDAVAGTTLTEEWTWRFYRKTESPLGALDLSLDFAPTGEVNPDEGTHWDDARGFGLVKFSRADTGYLWRVLLQVDSDLSFAGVASESNAWPETACKVSAQVRLNSWQYDAVTTTTTPPPGVMTSTVTKTTKSPITGADVTKRILVSSPPFSKRLAFDNFRAGPWADPKHPQSVANFDGWWDSDIKPPDLLWREQNIERFIKYGTAGRVDNGPAGIRVPMPDHAGSYHTRRAWPAGDDGGNWVASLSPGELKFVDTGQGGMAQYTGPAFAANYSTASKHPDTPSWTASLSFALDLLP